MGLDRPIAVAEGRRGEGRGGEGEGRGRGEREASRDRSSSASAVPAGTPVALLRLGLYPAFLLLPLSFVFPVCRLSQRKGRRRLRGTVLALLSCALRYLSLAQRRTDRLGRVWVGGKESKTTTTTNGRAWQTAAATASTRTHVLLSPPPLPPTQQPGTTTATDWELGWIFRLPPSHGPTVRAPGWRFPSSLPALPSLSSLPF